MAAQGGHKERFGVDVLDRPEIGSDDSTAEKTRTPRMWHCIVLNDDFTPFEFAVLVISRFFNHSVEKAWSLARTIHTQGKAVVGTYTRDVAETKAHEATMFARGNGHPLMVVAEPAEGDDDNQ